MKKGDVVRWHDAEWTVGDVLFTSLGMKLLLLAEGEQYGQLARPGDCTLVGAQLPLMEDQR